MPTNVQKGASDVNTAFWAMLGLTELDVYKVNSKMQEGKISELKAQVEALKRDQKTLQWSKSFLEGEHRLLKAAYDELWEAIPDAEITVKDRGLSHDTLQF